MIDARHYRADKTAIELEKAMRGAARRKLAAGVEPRNALNDALRFHEPKTGRLLITVAILSAVLFVSLIAWELFGTLAELRHHHRPANHNIFHSREQ